MPPCGRGNSQRRAAEATHCSTEGLPRVESCVALVGCDVNRAALEQAEAGRYGRRSIRGESPLLDRYLSPTPDSLESLVSPVVRASTPFSYRSVKIL